MSKKNVEELLIAGGADENLRGKYDQLKTKEEFVAFDVSMRIPGSPGTRFTPCTTYLYGEPMSYGERIALELKKAIEHDRLIEILS